MREANLGNAWQVHWASVLEQANKQDKLRDGLMGWTQTNRMTGLEVLLGLNLS